MLSFGAMFAYTVQAEKTYTASGGNKQELGQGFLYIQILQVASLNNTVCA